MASRLNRQCMLIRVLESPRASTHSAGRSPTVVMSSAQSVAICTRCRVGATDVDGNVHAGVARLRGDEIER